LKEEHFSQDIAQLSREPLLSLQDYPAAGTDELDSLLQEKDVLNAQVYTTDYKILASRNRTGRCEGWTHIPGK